MMWTLAYPASLWCPGSAAWRFQLINKSGIVHFPLPPSILGDTLTILHCVRNHPFVNIAIVTQGISIEWKVVIIGDWGFFIRWIQMS